MRSLYNLYEETTQAFINDNFNRELTEIELNRMMHSLEENLEIQTLFCDIMYIAGKDALDNSKNCWKEIDKQFNEGNGYLESLNCKAK